MWFPGRATLLAALLAVAPFGTAGAVTLTVDDLRLASLLDEMVAAEGAAAPLLSTRDHWRERFASDLEIDDPDGVRVALEGNFVDLRERETTQQLPIDPAALLRRKSGSLGDAGVDVALFDDRLRVESRYGWSLRGDEAVFADVSRWRLDNGFGSHGALSSERREAFSHAMEASFLRSNHLELAAFGTYQRADSGFSTSGLDGGGGFGDEGRSFEYGGRFRAGPVEATVSRKTARQWIDREREDLGPTRDTLEVSATLSLYGFREHSRDVLGTTTAQLIPDAVWASFSGGTVEPQGDGSVSDAIRTTSFGASWSADTWSVGVDYWRSVYDSRRPGAEDADWEGEGLYLNYGYYRERWGIYATGGLGRYSNLAQASRTDDLAVDASLTLQLTPEALPKLTTGVSYGRYDTDYVAWSGEASTRGLSFTTSLDFARYLPESLRSRGTPRLELGYRYTAVDTGDSFAGSQSTGEHATLLMVQLPF
jgi:hypothetical protein